MTDLETFYNKINAMVEPMPKAASVDHLMTFLAVIRANETPPELGLNCAQAIEALTGNPKASTYRHLKSLVNSGLITKEMKNDREGYYVLTEKTKKIVSVIKDENEPEYVLRYGY